MIDLSPTDVAVLNVLIRAKDWVHPRMIQDLVFPSSPKGDYQTMVRLYVMRLRRKGIAIENLFGYGYRYVVPS